MQVVCILLMLLIGTLKFIILEKYMHCIRITGGEMSTHVCMYVHIAACIQVLYTGMYKPRHMPLVSSSEEIHCSGLYVNM